MAIRVTCPSCHTRFDVSDKFAGKEGPCPKCKSKIRVPDMSEQVVIHAPQPAGPRDSKGGFLLKPIRRKETKLTGVQIALIVLSVVGFLLAALILRFTLSDDVSRFPTWLLVVAAVVVAPPLAFVGYHLLRDQELGAWSLSDLRGRIAICTVVYAALWFCLPLAKYAFDEQYNLGSWMIALIAMIGLGGIAGMYLFDLEYMLGVVHYGMYLLICLIGRWIAGIGFLPTSITVPRTRTTTSALTYESSDLLGWVSQFLDCFFDCVGSI